MADRLVLSRRKRSCLHAFWLVTHAPTHGHLLRSGSARLGTCWACSLPPRIFLCNTHIQTTIEVHIQLQRTPRNALGYDRGSERSSTVYALSSVFNWLIICMYVYYGRFGSVRISVTGPYTAWVSNLFWQRATPLTMGWFAGHTWKNNNKWYT